METELKPCPFCGDESPILKTEFIGELGFSYTKVQCLACGASISAYSKEEMAIKVWNRRASKTPCDLCRFNPPSSMDGKPCTMCVADGRTEDGNEE